jgi:hypothetical protein
MAIQAVDPREPALRYPIDMRELAKDIAYEGIVQAVAAKIFALHSFMGGFYFGVGIWLTQGGIDAIYTIAHIDANDRIATTIKKLLKLFVGPAMAALMTTAIGFPISFPTAVVLNFSTCGMAIGITVCGCLVGIAVMAAKAAIAILRRMYNDRCNARQAIENIRNDGLQNRDAPGVNAIAALDQMQRVFNQVFRPDQQMQRRGC